MIISLVCGHSCLPTSAIPRSLNLHLNDLIPPKIFLVAVQISIQVSLSNRGSFTYHFWAFYIYLQTPECLWKFLNSQYAGLKPEALNGIMDVHSEIMDQGVEKYVSWTERTVRI